MTCEPIDCPICFEVIGVKNNITTECGHQFHASCLMTNITRNGFGCPCCRAVMADEPDDATEVDDEQWVFDETEVDDYSDDGSDELFADDDDALRGLRLFANRIDGNEHDQEDVVAEFQYLQREEEENRPPTWDLVSILLAQQGVTYEQLVAEILTYHDEYEDKTDELERTSNDLWGKLRVIISNFKNNRDHTQNPVVAVEEPVVAVAEELVVAVEEPVAAARGLTLSDLSSIQECLEDEFEFAEGGGFHIAEMHCHNWRDTIFNEVDELWSDIECVDFQALPMIHV